MKVSRSFFVFSLIAVLAAALATWACTSVYTIWMIRSKSADPLYRFTRGDRAGYIDRTGKIVITPRFDTGGGNYGGEFHNGLLEIGDSDGEYVNNQGRTAIRTKLYRGWDFSEGLAAAMPEEDGKWGYIDPSGKFVISPRFDAYPAGLVSDFSEGLAKIEVKEGVGYIDRRGEFAIPPRFARGENFSDGMAAVVVDGPCFYVDRGPCPNFGAAPLAFRGDTTNRADCKYTFIDKTGQIIPGARYDAVKDFSEGLAAVLVADLWGYVDKTGAMVIAPKFADASQFADGLALIRSDKQYGYIDRSGALAITPQFTYAEDFSGGLAVVSDNPNVQYWYIDRSGKPATGKKYALASHYFEDLAHVRLLEPSNTFAYIDKTGKEVFRYRP